MIEDSRVGSGRKKTLSYFGDRPEARSASDKTAIERQIGATDKQIDALVYELYGLMEEEIRIAEGEQK